jgi:glutathione S-transferase
MALRVAGIRYTTIEINLRDKPAHMVRVSPKATVPVLCLSEHEVIEESLDIMQWALGQADPLGWLKQAELEHAQYLLQQNDGPFKRSLDQYKYASRFLGADPKQARQAAVTALIQPLAQLLSDQPYIGGQSPTLQDIAIFPFVRQFANVEPDWFAQTTPDCVSHWLASWLASDLFAAIMQKPV